MRKPGLGIWFGALLLALVLGTYAFDWLAVPVIAAAFAWIRRDDASVPLLASVAGAASWMALLVWQSMTGSVTEVARVVGEAMQVGGGPLLGLTIAFPALLAGAAAGLVRGVRQG
ncbi:hypothetical protein Strain138_001210 [Pseudogemmatithrix spongiicola]|uniref:Uncharacterized protein n=1 Tax=Pseudogemmatithrix spongiicola TaxID=3062599 RepID=A0AA49Q4N7_9BACT|nr:hypothetical protein Strain138_001210 [Gemmatimonadaceae bacterium 'strain 138']WKW14849.1 hypothetical protein Strain318_001210 [Gemmatimonadaceae bacterium 'strain 318']